jgi:putative ABC transport system permease protein
MLTIERQQFVWRESVDTLIRDVRYAIRSLLNTTGFTAVAVITLALGIGANTAMFSVVNTVLLRPLPFRDPQRLLAVVETDPRAGENAPQMSVSYPDFVDIRARSRTLEAIAAFKDSSGTLTGSGEAVHVNAESVSAGLFNLLGVQPVFGRGFLEAEDEPGHHVVVLSDGFWRRYFHEDRGVLGKTVELNGKAFVVAGVMPQGFQFPVQSHALDLWLTFSSDAETDDPEDLPITAQRGAHLLGVIARTRPGVSLQDVSKDLASIAGALAKENPHSNLHTGIGAKAELEQLVGDTRTPLLMLFAAVALVLLIACANVANLLLARSTGRRREMALRLAIGATRARIVRQLVTESVVLSIAGAALGILAAYWALSGVLHLYPSNLPRALEVGIDWRVLVFTTAVAIATGVLFGLAPALEVSNPNLTDAIRDASRTTTAGPRQNQLRSGLVILQTALGVMLLIGAGLLLRSFERLSHTDLGFNPNHLMTASFDLSETRYDADGQDQFVGELFRHIKALPGVTAAAGAVPLPLSNNHASISFNLLDHPVPEESQPSAGFYSVVPGFFETMQIPLVRGRTFDDRDQRNSAPVMIITQALAKKFFANEDPVGRKIEIGAGEGPARKKYKTREVVGVVGDIRTSNLRTEPAPAYYVPLSQLMWGAPTLLVRTASDPAMVISEIRKTLAGMDPDAPLYDVRNMEDYLVFALGLARFQTMLLSLFAGVALLLTAVGLYGVMAFAVGQRTHEIGVRRALGASTPDVLRLVMGHGVSLTLAGIGIGLAGALALARIIEGLLYEVQPHDPITYLSAAVALAFVALLACYIPASRAARVDPLVALRYE